MVFAVLRLYIVSYVWCWCALAAIVNVKPTLSSERMLHKDYDCKDSLEKITGRESQED
jgi:hypothetical protein